MLDWPVYEVSCFYVDHQRVHEAHIDGVVVRFETHELYVFHLSQFRNRRLHVLNSQHILLIVKLLDKLVHGTHYLLISELNVLCKVVRALFILRFNELSYKTLQGQAHAVYRFCDVTLRTDAHYLVEKKLLWSLINLALRLFWHTDRTRVELVFLPKWQTTFKCVIHIDNLTWWELEFYNEPFKRE